MFIRAVLFAISFLLLAAGILIGDENGVYQSYAFVLAINIGILPWLFQTVRDVLAGNFQVEIVALMALFGGLLLDQKLAGAIYVIVLTGSNLLKDYSERLAREQLCALERAQNSVAHLIGPTEQVTDVASSELKNGHQISVRSNEVLPVDGLLLSQNAKINAELLGQGDSPIMRSKGDWLLSGMQNQGEPIRLRVINASQSSTLQQIIKLLNQTEQFPPPLLLLVHKLTAWLTPLLIVVAILVYLLTRNLVLSYTIFLIATPRALLWPVSLSLRAAIARAARMGVVVRNGQALELLSGVDTVVFDKTGTLTLGSPQVSKVVSLAAQFSEQQILQLAASLDVHSTHLVARSVVKYALEQGIELLTDLGEITEVAGRGVYGTYLNQKLQFGSTGYVQENGVLIEADLLAEKLSATSRGQIISWVTIGERVIGYLLLSDELRPDAVNLVDAIKSLGIRKIMMLTGDTNEVAIKIASAVGISEVISSATPQMKLQTVSKLMESGFKVAMIGDGINDAPSLSMAQVGLAIVAGGETIASQAADIVLLRDGVARLTTLIALARQVFDIMRQEVVVTVILVLLGILLAALGLISPAVAALLQGAMLLALILSSLRILRLQV